MLALVIVIAIVLVAVVVLLVVRERRAAAYRASHPHTAKDLVDARSHSVATSRGTTRGLAAEHLAPFFPELIDEFSPSDWRFLGTPVDFVVFDGLGEEQVTRLVLLEVKGGRDRRLSPRQQQIRAAVLSGQVRLEWMTVRVPGAGRPGRRVPRRIALPPDDPAE